MNVKTGIIAGQGLGNTIADLTRISGVDQLATIYEETTGKPCGCGERRELLNNLFPFGITYSA